jgi:EAL and modified HD-GYP domain-containing signal transduction protein
MLAEKVETVEEFDRAVGMGFQLLQGYFFSKPVTISGKRGALVESSYMRLLMELNRPGGVDFAACAKIVHSDASLTYRVIQKVQKLAYYRGNMITAIQQALVMMGTDEVRRWALLVLARDNNTTKSEELVRKAYLRGTFSKRLMEAGPNAEDAECGFLLGMFSLLDQILNVPMAELLEDVELPDKVTRALLGETDNFYGRLLQYVEIYDSNGSVQELPDIGIHLSDREIARAYMDSVVETDRVFV